MSNIFYFKEKDCPFCNGGQGSDDRSNVQAKCNHSFTATEHNAMSNAIESMKLEIKNAINIGKKMRKIMGATK